MELLFDLETDPGERKTLAFMYPDKVEELRKAAREWDATLPAIQKK